MQKSCPASAGASPPPQAHPRSPPQKAASFPQFSDDIFYSSPSTTTFLDVTLQEIYLYGPFS